MCVKSVAMYCRDVTVIFIKGKVSGKYILIYYTMKHNSMSNMKLFFFYS